MFIYCGYITINPLPLNASSFISSAKYIPLPETLPKKLEDIFIKVDLKMLIPSLILVILFLSIKTFLALYIKTPESVQLSITLLVIAISFKP
ncbi:hypothetical protein MBCUT_01150 [Methanobrevibacter cuticularis]|uniref:Uncharacterized protein n=1 Tax=Methanobrevibacter cuticularis TaxID=47311 RepID=A0A166FIM4_9EURY|nr:hypothetical protein MBCUT_01150 [Methanobrevibacter cuticularis]